MNGLAHPLLEMLYPYLERVPSIAIEGKARFVLFFSFTDGKKRADVVTCTGSTAEEAWALGAKKVAARGTDVKWLRLDWVDAAERANWQMLRRQFGTIKRNYFRLGISLDARFEHAFLEAEVNANAMLYGGPGQPSVVLNEKNFAIYAARRHGLADLAFADDNPVWLFTTGGVFVAKGGSVHTLVGGGANVGRRSVDRLTAGDVEKLVSAGSRYLASQVLHDGRFEYGWHPCFDRPIPAYNTLRHASTVYAMLESWEVTRDAALWKAIERALEHLVETLIRYVDLPGGGRAAFLIDTGNEIKLGGNAVAILALVKHAELAGEVRHRDLLDALGHGILHMQIKTSGAFTHVLNYPALDVNQDYRIIYYDGEAAFGLMRLYKLTGDQRWLAAVENAMKHFIAKEHWKAHDHWLGYCVDELTMHRPDERYYRFAIENIRDYIGFVLERITTFPTLLELIMAAQRTITRVKADRALRHLLIGVDLRRFDRALHHRAHHLLNGHFWPELAMFYANPAKIVGSFFIRHHGFRVRIDDVEHYLSGLVAYRKHLLEREADQAYPSPADIHRHWDVGHVERATGGRWISSPPPNWHATGLAISPPTLRPGEMVAVRLADPGIGISLARLPLLKHPPAALIVDDAAAVAGIDRPVLAVKDVGAAILALGHYARDQMTGRLVAVTGSAGKTTTVAMMAHALSAFGAVGQTRNNANLPHGVAWNLASMPWEAPHMVLELAIGRMAQTTRLARPDIVIFTNVLPAHLEYHRDLATVAMRKSAVFEGMTPGGVAVLNRDMAEWERVHMAAKARGLDIVHYGRAAGCDFRLLAYELQTGEVFASLNGQTVRYRVGAVGEHMALNSLAVLAAVSALGLDLEPALATLVDFAAAEGRGNEFRLDLGGRRVTVIDDAYNANPGSMEAALAALGGRHVGGRRIVVLGEMLELGDDAASYHRLLAPLVAKFSIDRVHVVGALYGGLWNALAAERRGVFASSLDHLKEVIKMDLRDNDTVLLKGSHGTGVHTLVPWLREMGGSVGDESFGAGQELRVGALSR